MMRRVFGATLFLSATLALTTHGFAQQPASAQSAVVPPLISFSGTLTDINNKPLNGIVGVTFLLYKDANGGAPLWIETQNVQADKNGNYKVMLGSTTSTGLPAEVFSSGEARWLAVQPEGQPEQPRVLLVAVPYALKAVDAETIGGLPPSAFVKATPSTTPEFTGVQSSTSLPAGTTGSPMTPSKASQIPPPATITGSGIKNYLPLFTGTASIGDSNVYQSTTGSTNGFIGIGTKTPGASLDVNGAVNSSSGFNLGGSVFAIGSIANGNVFLGFSGNGTTSGTQNTANGAAALLTNTSGSSNTADGYAALDHNQTGKWNTGTGSAALYNNTQGIGNTADGYQALYSNFSGAYNTAVGWAAGPTVDGLNYSTAIGAGATVSESNAVVLGGTGAASVNVGIGTNAPSSTFDLEAGGAGLAAPITFLKNTAPIQSGATGNSVDIRFAVDGGATVNAPNASISAQENGNGQYGTFLSFGTVDNGGFGTTERMRIASNGYVGVGTTTPAQALDVAGSVSVSGTVAKYNGQATAGNGIASVLTAANYQNQTGNSAYTLVQVPSSLVRISIYTVCTAPTGHSGDGFTLSVSWTDEVKTQSVNVLDGQGAKTVNCGSSSGDFAQGTFVAHLPNSPNTVNLSYQTVGGGTGTYNLYATIERLE